MQWTVAIDIAVVFLRLLQQYFVHISVALIFIAGPNPAVVTDFPFLYPPRLFVHRSINTQNIF